MDIISWMQGKEINSRRRIQEIKERVMRIYKFTYTVVQISLGTRATTFRKLELKIRV